MKPFATLGSEIGKVRAKVRERTAALRAETLSPAALKSRLAADVRDQREKLLARLGEQTLMLIAERKLTVPAVLREPVERLAALLGLKLPSQPPPATPLSSGPASSAPSSPAPPRGASSRPAVGAPRAPKSAQLAGESVAMPIPKKRRSKSRPKR
ncbi:MAG: hypothetical protein JNL79_22760 [Myxococcales bacterium]|nr:hypothetical protein [Myxococcales bacterium]